jgi:hypothetical protein
MVELKDKLVKYSLLSGKKAINEKKMKVSFKKFNINLKKKTTHVLQFIIYWSSFIFKYSSKTTNSSYFFVSKGRIFFALKQIVMLNFFNKRIEDFKKELTTHKKLQNKFVTNKKLLHFYRWTNK